MSAETFSYKGISAGKYIEGEIEAINQEEASFKLKEQKIIITNLIKVKKKKDPFTEGQKKSSGLRRAYGCCGRTDGGARGQRFQPRQRL